MAREMFNPHLALFVAVPEGGSTFQPNPNSFVQSDTNISHLDYFRFVGRVVRTAAMYRRVFMWHVCACVVQMVAVWALCWCRLHARRCCTAVQALGATRASLILILPPLAGRASGQGR